MVHIKVLRENNVRHISNNSGYYKWWCNESTLLKLLDKLNVSLEDVRFFLEYEENLYCIYVGITGIRSLNTRVLGEHVYGRHSLPNVRNGGLSTLRQTISSLMFEDQSKQTDTDNFIDSLFVEWFELDAIKLPEVEIGLINRNLRLLNIKDNNHPEATNIKLVLKAKRRIGKENGLRYLTNREQYDKNINHNVLLF